MYKLKFKNTHGQPMEVHGKIGKMTFIPNEGNLINLTDNQFDSIEKVD
jgi:hypothetical protein